MIADSFDFSICLEKSYVEPISFTYCGNEIISEPEDDTKSTIENEKVNCTVCLELFRLAPIKETRLGHCNDCVERLIGINDMQPLTFTLLEPRLKNKTANEIHITLEKLHTNILGARYC